MCRLLRRMARMDMDSNLIKLGQFYPVLMMWLQKSPKNLIWSVLPWWNLFLYNATGAFRVWVKALSNDFRAELTQNNNILQNPYK